MAEEKIKAAEVLSDEDLDGVAGGTRAEFNEICGLLGKSSTWSTRNGIRDLLKKNYGITVEHWNTGDRGSANNAPAEFSVYDEDGFYHKISFDQTKRIIKGELTISGAVSEIFDNVSVYE